VLIKLNSVAIPAEVGRTIADHAYVVEVRVLNEGFELGLHGTIDSDQEAHGAELMLIECSTEWRFSDNGPGVLFARVDLERGPDPLSRGELQNVGNPGLRPKLESSLRNPGGRRKGKRRCVERGPDPLSEVHPVNLHRQPNHRRSIERTGMGRRA